MEILDICDELGNPTGKTVEREIAHQQGILHRTAHVWILRKKENKIQILLQKRSEQKDSFPGCYDISSAGHIPAGDNYGQSAVRELKEELGIVVRESELIDCGNRRFHFEEIFHGRLFKDNQVSKIFVLWKDLEEKDCILQIEQKGVDMRIGLDIASLAYKKQVDQIVLISGDSDFVSAAKLARREGIDFILDPLGAPVKPDLFEHIDGLRTSIQILKFQIKNSKKNYIYKLLYFIIRFNKRYYI